MVQPAFKSDTHTRAHTERGLETVIYNLIEHRMQTMLHFYGMHCM